MKNNKRFPQQTHFLGVLVPEELRLSLEDCRRYMNETYGCRSGYGTPIHVTLIPPFLLPKEFTTKDLIAAIQEDLGTRAGMAGFTAHVCGFDAFGDRTIFAKVLHDDRWTALRDAVLASVLKAAPGCTKKDQRPFQPHLTVANRDIPAGASVAALKALNELRLQEDFPVDNVTVFERHEGKWLAAWSGSL